MILNSLLHILNIIFYSLRLQVCLWDNSSKFIMELGRQFDKFISQAIFQQSVHSKKQYPSVYILKGICELRIFSPLTYSQCSNKALSPSRDEF